MRIIFILSVLLITSCNNNKIDKLESEVRTIKETLIRIEAALSGKTDGQTSFNTGDNNTNQVMSASPGNSYNNSKSTKNYSKGRCMAITKKGTQCSRTARSKGYCWQHGG
jgi:hypothetical protein